MGIKNLNKFLRNNCPEVFHTIHLSEYSYKKISIDISLYLFKYKTIFGDKWLTAFINLIACLRRNEIHCVFIYDTSAPVEKTEERKVRSQQREKLVDKITTIEHALARYLEDGTVDDILVTITKKSEKLKRLLGANKQDISISDIEDEIIRLKKQIVSISSFDKDYSKELFKILDVPYFNAIMEAETSCSDLCIQGKVDAVLSEDTDVLAYGTPVFLSKINTSNDTCVRIYYSEILEKLELSQSQFTDLCVMSGNDYNKNIPKIGTEKAYKLLLKHQNIEGIETDTNLDTSILNYKRSRELFIKYPKMDVEIPYCGHPDFEKLSNFLFRHNLHFDLNRLHKDFDPPQIIFE